MRVRFRIDGVLHEEMKFPRQLHAPLVSRFKILAKLDIAERRIPQDGRIPLRVEGREVYNLSLDNIFPLSDRRGGRVRFLERNVPKK